MAHLMSFADRMALENLFMKAVEWEEQLAPGTSATRKLRAEVEKLKQQTSVEITQLRAELENEPTKTINIIFNCAECDKSIIENSKDHDECICNEDGDRWWCDMCHNCDECKKNTKWCASSFDL
tara:strand:+ start:30 stop:401 length:372 start_codon:yes stop_codon:yes gene_type:complete